jgi:hypothetical protein
MITIDGDTFDVDIIALDESCDFLDKYAERTEDGILHRELIGTYHNQKIQFGTPTQTSKVSEYARLWLKLCEAEEFHEVTVPDTDGVDFTFQAYFSNVKRSLRKQKTAKVFWKTMTVNFIAQSPRRTP